MTKPKEPGDKLPRGRPTKFKPEFVELAANYAALGATDYEIAKYFEVDEATLNRWKHSYPELCASLKTGKEAADARVKQSLYRRAVGYTFDSEKVFQFQGVIVRAPVVEHVPPDTTAGIFWLKNRDPENWRDKRDGPDGDPDGEPNRLIIEGGLPDDDGPAPPVATEE